MSPAEILNQHQIRKTAARVAIIQVLQNNPDAMSEAEIKEQMGDLYDRITFYRNMQNMSEAGVLHRIVVSNILVKYALNHCEKKHCHHINHAHFYCRQCETVTCLGDLQVKAKIPDGFVEEEIELLIRGVCDKCNQHDKR